jgi:hypothetical protein
LHQQLVLFALQILTQGCQGGHWQQLVWTQDDFSHFLPGLLRLVFLEICIAIRGNAYVLPNLLSQRLQGGWVRPARYILYKGEGNPHIFVQVD